VHESVGVGAVTGVPRQVLRGEGLALFGLGTAAFAQSDLSWWLYAILFLAPDIGFAGYLAGLRTGAFAYNALHTLIAPAVVAGVGFMSESALLFGVAAVWTAHIGDRMLGYGLKYSTGFADTHLGPIGRSRVAV
jgi:hypothetical protein